MKLESNATPHRRETVGLILGFIGVLGFSVSLPATRVAVKPIGWVFVSFGRAVVAGVLALVTLAITKSPRPSRALLPRFGLVIGGVVLGFPAMTGLALRHAPAGHGAVVIGLLPAATAGWSLFRSGERPSPTFWVWAAVGVAAVTYLAVTRASTRDLAVGDLYLLAAVVFAAIGYTEGAILSKTLGGWQTISWAVVLALPITITLALIGLPAIQPHVVWTAWFGFAYISVVSMYVAFFAWYSGLAMGGVARVSQIQLLQPVMSLVWAAIFLHEHIDALIAVVALIVLISVFGSKRSAIAPSPTIPASHETASTRA
jgi:drug/metabolite transporter (DMT)-like permease